MDQQVGQEQTIAGPESSHTPLPSLQTASPMHAQLGSVQTDGCGMQCTIGNALFVEFTTHVRPAASQASHELTRLHSVTGTQSPVQQLSATAGTSPFSHVGLTALHVTSASPQLTSSVQCPALQPSEGPPSNAHADALHSAISQAGAVSPGPSARQLQQSSTSVHPWFCPVHSAANTAPEPAAPD
jgi:hypothetical protein